MIMNDKSLDFLPARRENSDDYVTRSRYNCHERRETGRQMSSIRISIPQSYRAHLLQWDCQLWDGEKLDLAHS